MKVKYGEWSRPFTHMAIATALLYALMVSLMK